MHVLHIFSCSRDDLVIKPLAIIALEYWLCTIMASLFPLLELEGNLSVWSLYILCERSIIFIEDSCSRTYFRFSVELLVISCLIDPTFLMSARMCPFMFLEMIDNAFLLFLLLFMATLQRILIFLLVSRCQALDSTWLEWENRRCLFVF